MKCPHCLENYHEEKGTCSLQWPNNGSFVEDKRGYWKFEFSICPACKHVNITVVCSKYTQQGQKNAVYRMIEPKGYARSPLPASVPDKFAKDYREACLVLADSPKASAALSRRCLQLVLRDTAQTTKKDLADQIAEVLPKLPELVS